MTSGSSLLRPALEAAMVVARTDDQADPTRPAPAPLRPYLRFARLPGPALEVARRVLDEDDRFRQRVAEVTTEEELGRPAWLWLNRPEGWEADLERLRKEAQDLEHAAREEKAERDARRRLIRAEDTARRAEAALVLRAREAEEARAQLAEERAARQAAEHELLELRTHLTTLREERNRAVRTMKEAEAELAHRTADLRHARHQLRMVEHELDQASKPAPAAGAVGGSAPAARVGPPEVAEQPPARSDATEAAAAVEEAAAAARLLGDALSRAAAALGPPAPADADQLGGTAGTPPPPASPPRRVPPRLPGGILDDSVAAAHHLLGLPGVIVLVDGYNVAKTAWPALPLAEERDRLVDALSALHARTGASVEVVFDGAEGVEVRRAAIRPAVQVRFSPPGVTADDVLVARVDDMPAQQAVIVVSSDHAVKEGARARGAAVLSARQLIGAMRR